MQFIRRNIFPTPEEYLEQQERHQDEFRKSHTEVDLAPLTDPHQLLALVPHSIIADDHKVAAKDLKLVASFKENFRDWSDIAAELPETARLDAAQSLLEEARRLYRKRQHDQSLRHRKRRVNATDQLIERG